MRGYFVDQSTQDQKLYSKRSGAAFYDQLLQSYELFSRTSAAVFWIKRKHEYKILKNFLSRKNFPQSPESTKKYSSKFNSYRSIIDIAQNFEHVQNNFNLYTRHI